MRFGASLRTEQTLGRQSMSFVDCHAGKPERPKHAKSRHRAIPALIRDELQFDVRAARAGAAFGCPIKKDKSEHANDKADSIACILIIR